MRLLLFFLVCVCVCAGGGVTCQSSYFFRGRGGRVIQYTLGPNLCGKKNSEYTPRRYMSNQVKGCFKSGQKTQLREGAYKAVVRSQLEYAAPVWDSYTRGDMQKIENRSLVISHHMQVSQT